MVYLALMLKADRNLALWPLLLFKGEKWRKVVFEAFRKLPEQQLDESVFSSLEEMLQTNDKNLQRQVLDILKLERMGRAASGSQSLIERVCNLSQIKGAIARRAILALGYFQSDTVIPVLIKALGGKDLSIKNNAITALLRVGQAAVVPLIEALRDSNWIMRRAATEALGRLGDERAVEPLVERLKDTDWHVRKSAAEALGRLGNVRGGVDG